MINALLERSIIWSLYKIFSKTFQNVALYNYMQQIWLKLAICALICGCLLLQNMQQLHIQCGYSANFLLHFLSYELCHMNLILRKPIKSNAVIYYKELMEALICFPSPLDPAVDESKGPKHGDPCCTGGGEYFRICTSTKFPADVQETCPEFYTVTCNCFVTGQICDWESDDYHHYTRWGSRLPSRSLLIEMMVISKWSFGGNVRSASSDVVAIQAALPEKRV